MSRWWFQVMRHKDDAGQPYLAIHEAYSLHDGQVGWTAKPVPIEEDTVDDLCRTLHDILNDIERHGVRDVETWELINERQEEEG